MQLEFLLRHFGSSPAIRLLRATHAPFVIAFFDAQFKQGGRISIGHTDLRLALTTYQTKLRGEHPGVMKDKPESYLSDWSAPETGWLHRFIESGQDEPSYQLTPDAELVFSYLDRVLEKEVGIFGTESRFKVILELLQDLVVGSTTDPDQRLEYLYQQRAMIDKQIAEIQSAGRVDTYGKSQIRERFSMAVSQLTQLQSDFRAVEEHFKNVARQVQAKQSISSESRGRILEFALLQEDLLKKEDQGRSFHEFVKLVHSPERQERLSAWIDQLSAMAEIEDQSSGLHKFRNMIPMLIAEAEKILRTTERLSQTLRKLLDVKSTKHRQRLTEILRDIQLLAQSMGDRDIHEDIGMELELEWENSSILERTFWSPPTEFSEIDFQLASCDDDDRLDAFRKLVSLESLDWVRLRDHVKSSVDRAGDLAIEQLVALDPDWIGPVELLGFIQIAHDDHHPIDPGRKVVVEIPSASGESRLLSVPQVTFLADHDSIDE